MLGFYFMQSLLLTTGRGQRNVALGHVTILARFFPPAAHACILLNKYDMYVRTHTPTRHSHATGLRHHEGVNAGDPVARQGARAQR